MQMELHKWSCKWIFCNFFSQLHLNFFLRFLQQLRFQSSKNGVADKSCKKEMQVEYFGNFFFTNTTPSSQLFLQLHLKLLFATPFSKWQTSCTWSCKQRRYVFFTSVKTLLELLSQLHFCISFFQLLIYSPIFATNVLQLNVQLIFCSSSKLLCYNSFFNYV